MFIAEDILEIVEMVQNDNFDIRTVTMGISLLDCIDSDIDVACNNVYNKILKYAKNLVPVVNDLEKKYGIPIIHKRLSVTPISIISSSSKGDPIKFAEILDKAAEDCDINFIGGYTALVQKGFSSGDMDFLRSIPKALSVTKRVCSSVNIGSTKVGINLDACKIMGEVIKHSAELTKDQQCIGAAKLVVFCNAVDDNPFMAGAFHGIGEPDCIINVGVSGPGVVRAGLAKHKNADITEIADVIKKISYKITRMGQLIGIESAKALNVPFGIVDLSLAPTPEVGDSVAYILEEMGLETCGTHGTTACLALLNDAIKKGGVMASSKVGGLSGAFIPVTEDRGMIEATRDGTLTLDKLEAMTAVCSVGLDMVVISGDTPSTTIAAIIADEAAIGMVNNKTTAVRIIPAIGRKEGDELNFGGLLGYGPIMPVHKKSSSIFINRGGQIPAPMHSLKN